MADFISKIEFIIFLIVLIEITNFNVDKSPKIYCITKMSQVNSLINVK